jgi:UDP-N-acetylglucosamine diphosphorylase/glucosamine-1-phosphate N-acetyltransferase
VNSTQVAVVIMAAGKGTRMKNPDMAKVMYEVDGKPMVHHVVDLALRLHSSRIIVVAGYQLETVAGYLQKTFPGRVEIAEQREQRGTGHAVMQAEPVLGNFQGDIIVLSGDVPLLRQSTIEQLQDCHRNEQATATILTADIDTPTGYGRIVRSGEGLVESITEERDADEIIKKIREINSGIYIFQHAALFEALKHVSPHNAQNEYYLTDVFQYFRNKKLRVAAVKANDFDEVRGVNTFEQLEETRKIFTSRLVTK